MLCSICLYLGVALHASSAATPALPDEAAGPVQQYIQANALGDASLLAQAFHPGALMYWVDADGHVASRTQAEWRKQMTAAGNSARVEQAIVAVDRRGDAAVVTVEGRMGGKPITDLMLAMKIGSQWRIVGKAFTRSPRTGRPVAEDVADIRAVVAAKLRSDTSFRGDELLATQHARAVFFNLDLEQLVTVSAAEWAARFDRRRREASSLKPSDQQIGPIIAIGDIGYARWTVHWSSGNDITDYSLLIRENGRWSMINTVYVVDDASK